LKQVVILCGGLGTRLESEEPNLPKALHVVAKKTLLEWQIESLGAGKFEILLLIGLEENFEKFIGITTELQARHGHKIKLITEKSRAGTAGSLKNIESQLNRKFIVLLGDILFDAPIPQLLATLEPSSFISAWVRETDHPMDSDLVELNTNGKFNRFSKYPHKDFLQLRNPLGLTGIYAIRKSFVRKIPKDIFRDIPDQLNALNTRQLKKCRGVVSLHSFRDVGTKKRFETAEEFLDTMKRKTRVTLVILDRDDTLMRDPINNKQSRAKYNEAIVPKLKKIKSRGFKVIFMVASNQPAIAKGFTNFNNVIDENKKLEEWLSDQGVELGGIKICPHHPNKGFIGENLQLKVDCRCRKPAPGMVIDFVREKGLNPIDLIVLGDSKFDFLLSRSLGCRFVWVRFGKPIHIMRNAYSLLRTVLVVKS